MKKTLLLLSMFFVLLASAAFAGKQDFVLVNKTGVEIHAVYVSPSKSNDWEEDILGDDTLPNGESVEITFDRSENASMWDLRIEDSDGNSIEWSDIPLKKVNKITLTYNQKSGKGTATFD
jgi:hypothetical protein